MLFLSPELTSSTCQKHPLSFQKLGFVKKVQNTDVAIESKEPKTPIKEIEYKSPSKHVAIENEDSKSISYARILRSTHGWENADPPNMKTINVLKHEVVGSTKNIYRGKTRFEDCKGAKSKNINNMMKNENKVVATTIQKSINPIGFVENGVFTTPNVLDVARERSKEEGDQKTADLKHESDVIEGDQKTVDLKHESDVIEGAKAKDQEERLLLKAQRKERKKQKKTNKKKAQTMNFANDSNPFDSISEAMNETGYEGEELVVKQTKVISSQQEQGVLNSQPYLEETNMGIPSSSTLERIIQKLFSFENTLVVSCNVAFIGVVLSIFVYIAVKFVETS